MTLFRRIAIGLVLLAAGSTAGAADVVGATVSAAFAPDGTLWRVIPRKAWIEVDRSSDFGRTFSDPVRLTAGTKRIQAQPEDRPQIGVDARGQVFVVFAADARQPWTRFVSFSRDGGRTFSDPAPLSSRADRNIQYEPALHVGPGGAQAFWIEQDARTGTHHASVGRLYSRAIGVEPASPGEFMLHEAMCECCRMATATDSGGGTAVFARIVLNGETRDHGMFTVSSDGTVLPMRRITDDEWKINACPESGPALTVSTSGRYHLSWFTQGRTRQGLFYAWSDDRGATLSPPVAIGAAGFLPAHAHLAAAGRTVAIAWRQYDGRETSIHAMVSQDDGASWSAAQGIGSSANAADYPFVLSHGGRLYVSWYAADRGYQLIPLATAGV